jgi:hypothetical protein
LAGLSIIGMNEGALQVHPEVLEYDRHFRELSTKAERVMEATDQSEIIRVQEEFLAKVAPLHDIRRKAKKQKTKKLNTFEQTAMLVKNQLPLADMAKERGMVAETIISHLEELVQLGPERGGIALSDIAYLKKEVSPIHFLKIEKVLETLSVADEKRRERSGEEYKPPLLSPVKRLVGANISFKEIRLVRLFLGYVKGKVSE